jgi:hypothetical protein
MEEGNARRSMVGSTRRGRRVTTLRRGGGNVVRGRAVMLMEGRDNIERGNVVILGQGGG